MNDRPHQRFSLLERALALFAGLFNLSVGTAFFFMPELHIQMWPEYGVSDVMARYVGSIILGNAVGAICLSTRSDQAHVSVLWSPPQLSGYGRGLLHEVAHKWSASGRWESE